MKKGFIRTFGDSKFGMGHVFRSLTIADEIIKNKGSEVKILLFPEEANQIQDMLAKDEAEVEIIERDKPFPQGDFLLYDMPYPDSSFISEFRRSNPRSRITALDYADSSDENVDVVLNLFDHKKMLSGRDENKHTVFRSGFEYAIIRKEFFPFRKGTKSISENLKDILIAFGGSDPNNHTIKIVAYAPISSGRNVTVIIGPRFSIRDRIAEFAGKYGDNVRFMGPVDNIQEFMSITDLIICGGGTTMLEAMFLGCPILVIPQTENERVFSNYAVEKKACLSANSAEESEIAEKIKQLESCKFRAKLSENAKKLVPGNGAENIVKELLK